VTETGWNLADVFERIADSIPDGGIPFARMSRLESSPRSCVSPIATRSSNFDMTIVTGERTSCSLGGMKGGGNRQPI